MIQTGKLTEIGYEKRLESEPFIGIITNYCAPSVNISPVRIRGSI
jgi:hypothetical protein